MLQNLNSLANGDYRLVEQKVIRNHRHSTWLQTRIKFFQALNHFVIIAKYTVNLPFVVKRSLSQLWSFQLVTQWKNPLWTYNRSLLKIIHKRISDLKSERNGQYRVYELPKILLVWEDMPLMFCLLPLLFLFMFC